MNHWNYRILAEVVRDHTEYYVTEVYYRGDEPVSWVDREGINVLGGWDDLDDLKGTIRQVQEAVTKPVLRVMGDRLEEWS